MWIPAPVLEFLKISKDSYSDLREDLAAVRAERDALRLQLNNIQNSFDWLKVRCNTLEIERAQYIEKLYGVKVPAVEIATRKNSPLDMTGSLFEDIGDKEAKVLGLPNFN